MKISKTENREQEKRKIEDIDGGNVKKVAGFIIAVGAVSFVVGIVSRVLVMPLPTRAYGLEASAFMAFTNTCLLTAIALLLLDKPNK